MINFNNVPCIYWSNTTKISYLQRRVIVWSILYYEYDDSCVPDYEYDSVSHQLVELQNQATKEEFEKSTYYYAMYDFNGSTGFNIAPRLTPEDRQYLRNIAMIIHEQRKENNKI